MMRIEEADSQSSKAIRDNSRSSLRTNIQQNGPYNSQHYGSQNSSNPLTPGTSRIEDALNNFSRNQIVSNAGSIPSNMDPAIENIEDAINFIK